MRRLVALLPLAFAIATPLHGEPSSLWTHNGSIVALYAHGPHRAFRYHAPREALREYGVAEGSLLFEGERSESSYAGTAYVFSRRCGAVPYPVSGAPSADERSIELFGTAPAGFDAACNATHFRSDVLRFDLKQVLIPPDPLPPAPVAAVPERLPEYVPQSSPVAPPILEVAAVPEAASPAVALFKAPKGPDAFLQPILWLLGCLTVLGGVAYIASLDASAPKQTASRVDVAPEFPPPPAASEIPPQPQPQSRIAMTLDAIDKPDQASALVPAPGAPYDKIVLKLRRSQRATALTSAPVFILDARVDLAPAELALIGKYRLGSLVIYDSKERTRHTEAAAHHFAEAQGGDLSLASTARSLWKTSRGLASAAMMALSLRVTVDKLISGQHIECRSMEELLGAEAAIHDACRTLRTYLDTAATFDGREELIEF